MYEALVSQLLDGKTPNELNRLCRKSGVKRPTIDSWITRRRTPRIDLFGKVAEAAEFELKLQPKTKRKADEMAKYQLVNADDRTNVILDRTRLVGYVEDDTLTGIDAQGYAVRVGTVNHRSEIISKLDAWRNSGGSTRQAV